MADLATLVLLNGLMDSDDEKPQWGKTRSWSKEDKTRDVSITSSENWE